MLEPFEMHLGASGSQSARGLVLGESGGDAPGSGGATGWRVARAPCAEGDEGEIAARDEGVMLDQGERVHGASTLFLYGHRGLGGRHITLYAARGQAIAAAAGALRDSYKWHVFVTGRHEARIGGIPAPGP